MSCYPLPIEQLEKTIGYTFNDKKIIKEYEELNSLLKNSGTIAMYIITILLAIAVIFLWPILLVYLFIKKNTKGEK